MIKDLAAATKKFRLRRANASFELLPTHVIALVVRA